MLTTEASNALLKTLEEPPDRVIFVMATTQPEDLEDTIRSRSQHFHFRALTFAEISGRLEHIAREENLKIEPGALAVIARMAEGSLRDALSLLEQARAYCGDNIPDKEVRELLGVVPEDALEELVNAIAEGSADRALGLVHRFQKDGRNLQHFCREAIRHIRNLLIARVSGADSELIAATADQRPALARAAALFGEEDLTRFFQILLQTDDSLRRAPDPRVHLEMGLLRLVNAGRLAPLEELMSEMSGGSRGGGASSAGAGRGVAANVAVAPKKMFTESASGAMPAATAGGTSLERVETRAAGELDVAAWRREVPNHAATMDAAAMNDAAASASNSAVANGEAAGDAAASVAADGHPAFHETFDEKKDDALNGVTTTAKTSGVNLSEVAAGISAEQVAEIKAAIQAEKKFLGELLEQSSRWQVEGAELRIFFPVEKRAFAELLEGREALEKIRAQASRVLGKPVRVCAKIESIAAAAAAGASASSSTSGRGAATSGATPRDSSGNAELRARFESDPMVRSMLERFGGKISEVKPPDS
jgi:DNA polymerase-3 subunit gamma/tau